MHCKHSFKNTTRFIVCIARLRNNVLYILKHKSNFFFERANSNLIFITLIIRRKITQTIINMPNHVFLNVFTLF